MAIRTTDIMAANGDYSNVCGFRFFLVVFAVFLVVASSSVVFARDWQIVPTVDVQTTFSDNINLGSSGSEKMAFVSEMNPGISIINRGRLDMDLNYRMQNIINEGGDFGYKMHHQLQANANAELVKRRLFLDVSSTASQQNLTNTGRNARDNLSSVGNRSDIYTFRVSPSWRPRLNGYVSGLVRGGYETVMLASGGASDSETYFANVNLISGHRFSRVTWAANFNNRKINRSGGNDALSIGNNDVLFRDYDATLRYHLYRKFNVFVRAGYFDNEFQRQTDTNKNGEFYVAGFGWIPNRWFQFEGSGGQNLYTATVTLNPTRRTTLQGTYRNTEVGTNIGTTWNGLIRHRTRRTVLEARYFEDTTTTQDVLLGETIFETRDQFGNLLTGPATRQPLGASFGIPTLTDEVLERRRGEVSFTGNTGKSTFRLVGYQEDRSFLNSGNEEQSIGVITSWNWRFTTRTQANIGMQWTRNTDSEADDRRDKRWDVSLALTRNLATFKNYAKAMFATVEYRHTTQTSSLPANEYDENRISANINVRF